MSIKKKTKNYRKKKTKNYKKKNTKKIKHKVIDKFNNLKCAPQNKNNKLDHNNFSCYSNKIIFELKNNWNKYNDIKIHSNNPRTIWNFLKSKLENVCNNELCWLHQKFVDINIDKNKIKSESFRPYAPESWKLKPYEWLSSDDIIKVMNQYEKSHDNFAFIGPSPIDFDDKKLFGTCVWEKLCKFDIKNYIKNKKDKIGIIFNLDPHYKGGSHWVALFIDIKKQFIFYFDSNGDNIPQRIKKLVNRIQKQSRELQLNLKYFSNYKMEHQQRDGQCGMYTLYFIIELLKETKTVYDFKNHRIPDKIMKDYRIKYYNQK